MKKFLIISVIFSLMAFGAFSYAHASGLDNDVGVEMVQPDCADYVYAVETPMIVSYPDVDIEIVYVVYVVPEVATQLDYSNLNCDLIYNEVTLYQEFDFSQNRLITCDYHNYVSTITLSSLYIIADNFHWKHRCTDVK